MNFKEGFRRITLAIGLIGATAGCCFSWAMLNDLQYLKRQHDEFQTLLHSRVVSTTIKDLKRAAERSGPWDKWKQYAVPSTEYTPESEPFDAFTALHGGTAGWTINQDGVKTIHFNEKGDVNEIVTSDSRYLWPTPGPKIWEYLLLVVYPAAGFFVPWLLLKGLSWVIAGFATKPS
jgi:hypothetical protein